MLVRTLLLGLTLLTGAAGALVAGRRKHDRRIGALRERLRVAGGGAVYRSELVAGLPPVARRFFARAIREGAPVPASACLTMQGLIGLRPGAAKTPFTAEQVISREGLVWEARVGSGPSRIVGDDSYIDGRGAMAWFLSGVIPVVAASGRSVSKSAAGRVALELAVMLPSALLPSEGARWEQLTDRTARVAVRVGDEDFEPVLTIGEDGGLLRVEMPRWDADAGNGVPGFVLWKADLEDHETFDGITIPTRMRVTKRWGTPDADPFFEATITAAHYY